MRNLPDEEVIRELGGRLQGYEELPDDVAWGNIAPQIPNQVGTWIRWADGSALTITFILFTLASFQRPENSAALTSTVATGAINIDVPTQLAGDVETPGFELPPTSQAVPQVPSKDFGERSSGVDQHTKGVTSDLQLIDATPTSAIQSDRISMRKAATGGSSTSARIKAGSDPVATQRSFQAGVSNLALSAKNNPDAASLQLTNDNVVHSGKVLPPGKVFPSDNVLLSDITLSFEHEREIEGAYLQSNAPEGDNVSEFSWTAEPVNLTFMDPSLPLPVVVDRSQLRIAPRPMATNTIVKRQTVLRHLVPLYFMVTPSLTYYQLSPGTNDAVIINSINEDGPFDKTRRALEIEVGIQLYLYRGLRFQGGINYYYQNNHITVTQLGLNGSQAGSSGPSSIWTAPKSETAEIEYRMNNVGVSAGLLYAVSLRQFSHQVGVGFQWQYGVGKKEATNYNNAGVQYCNYSVFYRLEFGLSESVRIFGQPGYTGAINATEAMDGMVTLKNKRIGLGFGVIKDF